MSLFDLENGIFVVVEVLVAESVQVAIQHVQTFCAKHVECSVFEFYMYI